jgi:uncharacterized protein
MLEFEWDEAKNRANIAKHGIDFNDAVRAFDGPFQTEEDDDIWHGEIRERTTGVLDGLTIVVIVHTDRDGRTRLISARRASPNERRKFETAIFPSAYG